MGIPSPEAHAKRESQAQNSAGERGMGSGKGAAIVRSCAQRCSGEDSFLPAAVEHHLRGWRRVPRFGKGGEAGMANDRPGRQFDPCDDQQRRIAADNPLGSCSGGDGALAELALGALVAGLRCRTCGGLAAVGALRRLTMLATAGVRRNFGCRLAASAVQRGEGRRDHQDRRNPRRADQMQQAAKHDDQVPPKRGLHNSSDSIRQPATGSIGLSAVVVRWTSFPSAGLRSLCTRKTATAISPKARMWFQRMDSPR